VCRALETIWSVNQNDGTLESQIAFVDMLASLVPPEQHEDACSRLRCLFWDLTGGIAANPEWLGWNEQAVSRVAERIHAAEQFELMPILADALEDAGCTEQAILQHCRGPGPHSRGCWVLGMVLARPRGEAGERDKYGCWVNLFTLRIRLNPTDRYAWANRAYGYNRIRRYDDAIADLNQTLEISPGYAWALRERGYSYQEKKDYERALADYDSALQVEPRNNWTYAHRGYVLNNQGKYDEAIEQLNRALRLAPNDGWALGKRGYSYLMKKHNRRAIRDFTRAIENDPVYVDDSDFSWAHACRAEAYQRAGERERAVEDFNRAIQLKPDFAWAYGRRGYAHWRLGQYRQAIADLEKAVGINPEDAWFNNFLAWMLATCPADELRNGWRAVDFATRACELTGWKTANYIDTLAAAHAESGDFEQAVTWQEKVLEMGFTQLKAPHRLKLFQAGKPYREQGCQQRPRSPTS
jgi:tetratricopeptide (TPR) repeat protein